MKKLRKNDLAIMAANKIFTPLVLIEEYKHGGILNRRALTDPWIASIILKSYDRHTAAELAPYTEIYAVTATEFDKSGICPNHLRAGLEKFCEPARRYGGMPLPLGACVPV